MPDGATLIRPTVPVGRISEQKTTTLAPSDGHDGV